MRPILLVAVAGLPKKLIDPFSQQLARESKNLRVLSTPPTPQAGYSENYLNLLYQEVATGFRDSRETEPHGRWKLNFVLLFLDKNSDSLRRRFELESLLVPLDPKGIMLDAQKKNDINRTVNVLGRRTRKLLVRAQRMLKFLANEVTTRDNKTSLLLPRANFGEGFEIVSNWIQDTVTESESDEEIQLGLKQIEDGLLRAEQGCFVGSGGLVFRAPAKAGARHGIAPKWDRQGEHIESCVIRGHLRFGVPFEPNFHYDCPLKSTDTRHFPSCHGSEILKRGRSHVNIAPNDNIR